MATRTRQLSGKVTVVRKERKGPVLAPTVATTATKTISSYFTGLNLDQQQKLNTLNLGEFDTPEFYDSIINITQSIEEIGFDPTFEFLKTVPPNDYSSLIFNSPTNEKLQKNYQLELDSLREKEKGVEGIYQCSKCGGKQTISRRKQVRSGDEGETIFITCISCGKKWKEH